jgi:hypothetical protein
MNCVRVGVGAALLLFATHDIAAQRLTADSLVGCYNLVLGTWDTTNAYRPAHYQTPPSSFRLDSALWGAGHLAPAYRRAPPPLEQGYRSEAGWAFIPPDSVVVFWGDGLVGANFRARIRGDSLVGRVFADTDARIVGRLDPHAPATAMRIACDPARQSKRKSPR